MGNNIKLIRLLKKTRDGTLSHNKGCIFNEGGNSLNSHRVNRFGLYIYIWYVYVYDMYMYMYMICIWIPFFELGSLGAFQQRLFKAFYLCSGTWTLWDLHHVTDESDRRLMLHHCPQQVDVGLFFSKNLFGLNFLPLAFKTNGKTCFYQTDWRATTDSVGVWMNAQSAAVSLYWH